MRNKILCGALVVVFIIAIIMTFVKGINVDTYYAEGYEISFTEKDTINLADIEEIANGIWGKGVKVQRIELFNDSAEIKVKDYNDEQLEQLKNKLNEKYNSDLQISNLKIEHVPNIKLRTIIAPYIIPVILSLVIVLIFYAIRYREARRMAELLICIVICEGIFYSLYAICRIPFNTLTMPIAMCIYTLSILGFTVYNENKK